jgi:hypothetical protein
MQLSEQFYKAAKSFQSYYGMGLSSICRNNIFFLNNFCSSSMILDMGQISNKHTISGEPTNYLGI